MVMRGIRGATTVEHNDKEHIRHAAQQLMTQMMTVNKLSAEQVGAAIFSSTEDLTATFPTTGVRQLPTFKWIPMFDTREPAVEGSLPLCIRLLLLVDVDRSAREIHHVYMKGAVGLRPDIMRG